MSVPGAGRDKRPEPIHERLVTARVDESLYADAQAILRRGSWVDPEQRRAAYLEQGWTRFDEKLDPYTPEEIEKERLRYRF